MSGHRVLVTGSRNWADWGRVKADLIRVWEKLGCRRDEITVVNGCARGLDTIARSVALQLEMRVEDHPGDWDQHGKAAGHRRNAEMVAGGAVVCIAYPLGESRGTRGCMAMAKRAGIPVWDRSRRSAEMVESQ